MIIAVLSDAHGNRPYFEKCLESINRIHPDKIVYLGDCFGYLREGDAVFTALRQAGAHILSGNHEAMLTGRLALDMEKEQVYRLRMDRERISSSNWQYLKSLRPEFSEEVDHKKILYVHGRPDDPLTGYLYEDDPDYDWGQSDYDYIFMGHTHCPYVKKAGKTTWVNAGSCGLPRDTGTAPGYAVLDTDADQAAVYRVRMDKKILRQIAGQKIHPDVYACLMRERNTR